MRRIAAGALLFMAGTIVGVLIVSLPVRARLGGSPGFLRLLGIGSLTFYACLLSSPFFYWLARRYPVIGSRWRRNAPIHLGVTAGMVALTSTVFYQLMMRTPGVRMPEFGTFLMMRFLTESVPFLAMIALMHAFEFHRRHREGELALAQSRLEALTAQLHPHFLFNTLQGISTLMHRDVAAADAMLSRLSDLLRQTLQRGDRQENTLRDEMEMLALYVEISRERYKDRLVVETDVSSDAGNALVPFFILQPLVENALRHGIGRRAGVGRVDIRARRAGDELLLSVADDGPGLSVEERRLPREGIGLSNTRQRLLQLYGDRQSLTLNTPDEGGMRVDLVIPFREARA
jgi:two-component system LytT family sensor kinase